MSANSTETEAAVLALSKALGSQNTGMKVVPSAPPADDSDSSNGSRHSDDLQVHEWELSKDEILRRAEAGDLSCKFLAGMGYGKGHFGFPYNRKEANKWLSDAKTFRSGSSLTDTGIRMTAEAFCYQYGFCGVTSSETKVEKAEKVIAQYDTTYIPGKFLSAVAIYESKIAEKPEYAHSRKSGIESTVAEVKECVGAKFVPAYSFYADRCFDKWKGFAGGYGETNYSEGVRLFHEAVEQGDLAARVDLAQLYYEGSYGVEKDPAKAERILQVAMDNNIPGAKGFRAVYSPPPSQNKTIATAPPPSVIFSTATAPPSVVQTQNQQKKKKKGGCIIA